MVVVVVAASAMAGGTMMMMMMMKFSLFLFTAVQSLRLSSLVYV